MSLFNFFRAGGEAGGSTAASSRRNTSSSSPSLPRSPNGPYAAVELVTGTTCCNAAAALTPVRLLASQAPSLPLPGCTSPNGCYCRYKKHPDRRNGGDRRLGIQGEINRWFHSKDRRTDRGTGRRWDD